MMNGQCEEVGVGNLLMALQLAWDGTESLRDGKILDPEVMVLVSQVSGKQNQSISRRERIPRERRVRDQANQPELCDRARGPTRFSPRSEPPMCRVVMLVGRP